MHRRPEVNRAENSLLIDRRALLGTAAAVGISSMISPAATHGDEPAARSISPINEGDRAQEAWLPLFNGRDLTGWKITPFGGEGEVTIDRDEVVLGRGASMTGITYTGKDFPKTQYEIRCEAQRVDGNDFFFGLTFPVNDSFCSWICGGWGGTVVGLSSIDSEDASENATRRSRMFRKGTWYRLHLRVHPARIEAFIDDERIIDQSLEEHTLTTRPEVALSKPLGISTWETSSRLRQLAWRRLDDAREE